MRVTHNHRFTYQVDHKAYVCLTGLLLEKDREEFIKNWINDPNTLEFLGLWETIHNPAFKQLGYQNLRKKASERRFLLTPQKWIVMTDAIGIYLKKDQPAGIYAHPDIALAFCTWLDPLFKLLVIKEFQQLKASKNLHNEWNLTHYLSKANPQLETKTMQPILTLIGSLPENKEILTSLKEEDFPYYAMFGLTPSGWASRNPTLAAEGWHMHDLMSAEQLIVLSNLEKINRDMIHTGTTALKRRLSSLHKTALSQLGALESTSLWNSSATRKPHSPEKKGSDFDKYLEALLNVPPMNK